MLATATLGRNQARSLGACLAPGATFNLWEGSIRGGKTYVSVLAFLLAVSQLDGDVNGQLVIVGKNLGSIYRNFFETIEKSEGLRALRSVVAYKQNAPTARIFGREVQVIGVNDGRAESKIRGMTILLVYVDEASVINEAAFKQILNRMSLDESKMFATTNPDSPAHWLKTSFIDRLPQLPDWRRFHFVMDDNPSLSEAVKARLRAQYTGLWYRRWIEGLWVAAEGAIFNMWDPAVHVKPWSQTPEMRQLISVGIDYGTTNATAALLLGVSKELVEGHWRSRLWLVDEWAYDSRQMDGVTKTDAELSSMFRTWLAHPHLPAGNPAINYKPRFIVLDPSAASFRAQLQKDGVQTAAAVNDHSGINLLASLLAQQQLVVTDRCPGFILEAPGYAWDPKASEKGTDQPVKVADHRLDGGRYAIATTEQFWRPQLDWPSELALAA